MLNPTVSKAFLFAFSLCLSSLTSAGQQTGFVSALHVRASDGLTYFFLNGSAMADAPACATHGYWMIKDETSKAGERQYALLLAAAAAKKEISVVGMNSCSRWSDGEDVNAITWSNP
ncbi:hypothetical protein R50072_02900 [Simiduia litorea]|uniref:hypothetical protein n=1 Tax=Simiduia litorea TaxID=1435348 RepID=UPI0036F4135C